MGATILIVDDEESILKALGGILEDEGFRTVTAGDGIDALAVAQREAPDLVMLDIWMPRMEGLETLQRLKGLYPDLIVIMMSGHGTIETAVKSTRMGAYDFIEKPLSLEKVVLSVNNALGVNRLRAENASLRRLVFQEHEIIGGSQQMARLHELVKIVAPTVAPVLVLGEKGTGKELVARAIHFHSSRREKPFVHVNCAAIPAELIEAELFGYEKGTFPGAATPKRGKFDLADGGTIFLHEIGDLPLKAQAKVLRITQERKFERLGGGRSFEVDVRIIAATNKILAEEVRAGRFNEELFCRLNVVPFNLPPLRERKEDIPALSEHFLGVLCRREGREIRDLAPEAADLLKKYDWPGNVKELKNSIERLLFMTSGTITADQIPGHIACTGAKEEAARALVSCRGKISLREAREEFEKDFIIHKLEENGWNISKTAEALELERSNLQRKIKSYGINLT